MLPSIESTTSKQHTAPKHHHSHHHSKELLSDEVCGPFLPLLNYDSNATLCTKRKLAESQWGNQKNKQGMSKIKPKGGGFRDTTCNHSKSFPGNNKPRGVKTHDLQFRFQSAMNVNKGWSIQNPNPRLQKLQGEAGRLNSGLAPYSLRNIDDYSALKRSLATPHVDYIYHHKQSHLIEDHHMKTSSVSINDRFSIAPSSLPESRSDKLPEIEPPHSRTFADISSPVSPPKNNEASRVHRKSCGCVAIERDHPQSIYTKWERKPHSIQSRKSLKSNSSSNVVGSRCREKTISDKTFVSPPKISQKKLNREWSLDNLRKKAKKVIKKANFEDKRLASKQNIFAKTPSNSKICPDAEQVLISSSEAVNEQMVAHNDSHETCEGRSNVISESNHNISESTSDDTLLSIVSPTCMERAATPKMLKMMVVEQTAGDTDNLVELRKTFKKLDSDGDGHLSFEELKQGLRDGLTKQQLLYLKEIYLLACESTFFGFEEFVAINQMCDVMSHVSPLVLEAYESIDVRNIDNKIKSYVELSDCLNKTQSGILQNSTFKELLISTMNLDKDDERINTILSILNKESSEDVISTVELLVFFPYLVSMTPNLQ